MKVETFPLSDVRLTQSPFKHAEDLSVIYSSWIPTVFGALFEGAGLEPKS